MQQKVLKKSRLGKKQNSLKTNLNLLKFLSTFYATESRFSFGIDKKSLHFPWGFDLSGLVKNEKFSLWRNPQTVARR